MTAAAHASTPSRLDVGPVRVSGRLKGNRARVIWDPKPGVEINGRPFGRLYVCLAANNVRAFDAAEPTYDGEVWTTHTLEGVDATFHIEWTRKGCPACGWQLGRLKANRIIAVGEGEAARATDHV